MPAPELLAIPMATSSRLDIYSGVARLAGKLWAARQRCPGGSGTAVVVIHPSSNFMGHYLLAALSPHGVDVIGANTRYIGNDSMLTMENCVLDIGAIIGHLRREGYDKVVLVGNSGGGGLSAMYQSQAESPTITHTPAGDPVDIVGAALSPADAVIELMAHPGRALVFTEWLDPAVTDESDPFHDRDSTVDMFDPAIGPPYSPDFLARYRAAQLARNRRITAWVRAELLRVARASAGQILDLPFTVHGTVADPRFLDLGIDESDREPGTMWGPPYQANLSPATLGHLSSLRSWLSQWSVDESRCNGPEQLAGVGVPVLVMYGTADQVCFPSHARVLYDAVPHDRKELVPIAGATHYFAGQPEHVELAAATIADWLRRNDLIA
ncbi:MAG: alpha/beta hydrolase [Geodermatophilaceae bacterium]|nr:alpha/beta hydrolase [Geodermatophilaceae bacterium]